MYENLKPRGPETPRQPAAGPIGLSKPNKASYATGRSQGDPTADRGPDQAWLATSIHHPTTIELTAPVANGATTKCRKDATGVLQVRIGIGATKG